MGKSINVKKFISNPSLILATCVGLGYFPIAPGTIGSILAVAIYLILAPQYFLPYAIILFFISFYVASSAEKIIGEKDSKKIIIDELLGMSIVLYFVPAELTYIILSFLLFRFFDIKKIFLVKKIEKIPGGIGIIGDDIVAAIYTIVCMKVLLMII